MTTVRKSGLLLHPTSLPGPGGIGSLGCHAREFVDFLVAAGQSLWQILPLGPTSIGNSPYSCYSAFAGNPLMIDLEAIVAEGDLSRDDLAESLPENAVDFASVTRYKIGKLALAAGNFFAHASRDRMREFWHYCDTTFWLHDYSLFMSIKEHYGGRRWSEWPEAAAERNPERLGHIAELLGPKIGEQKYHQWQFARQWHYLKSYANERGVQIIGDMPIFVAYDSADVWCNRHLFSLDAKGRPSFVAGVPPDYFSKTGQRWGNPLYDWPRHAEDRYGWWVARMGNDLLRHDLVRIDHFRGFEAFWEIPASAKTAVHGRWVKGPGRSIFDAMLERFGSLPVIAEDLGVITPEVEALRDQLDLPGMKILQFAFDSGPDNPYLPHNYRPESVVYTGTHDNDTTAGWLAELDTAGKRRVAEYLGIEGDVTSWHLVRAALASVASLAVIPVQDILGLDNRARMNMPGTTQDNWSWRLGPGLLTEKLAARLRKVSDLYGRVG